MKKFIFSLSTKKKRKIYIAKQQRKKSRKNVKENQLENKSKKKFEGKSLTEKIYSFFLQRTTYFLIEKNT